MDTYKKKFTILELEIFSFLCIRAGEKFSQRDVAKNIKVSPTAVSKTVKRLLDKNLIKFEKTKTINFITFNRDNHKAIELKRAENLRQIYLSELSDFLEENLAGSTIVLFGSHSKGEDTISSDIDLAVLGRKAKFLDLRIFEKILNREININFYNSLKDIHSHLRNNILNGIILTGNIEL